jgi:hypothetical protein
VAQYSRISPVSSLVYACLAAPVILCAQGQQAIDFAGLIRTPAGIQAALERCDGNPDFETALANWLETAQGRSQAERDAIRQTSLRLLEDTTDRQLVLGLINGLIRHALDDVKRDSAIVPKQFARALYVDIAKATNGRKSTANEFALLAHGLAEGVTDSRQVGFVKEFVNLAAPRPPRPVSAATLEPKTNTSSGQ